MSYDVRSAALIAWRAVLRPILAYSAASLAAGLVLVVAGAILVASRHHPDDFVNIAWVVAIIAVAIAALTIVPATIALIIARAAESRRGFADAVAGSLIGAYFGLFGGLLAPTIESEIAWVVSFALAGSVGGLTYWMANGRPQPERRRKPTGRAASV